jgi:peptidoglycan/LPS O-acetylase OafA/YrhL
VNQLRGIPGKRRRIVNMSRMGQGQMVVAVGGVVLIISVFLHWVGGQSAWSAFSSVHILMLLIGIAAVAFAVLPVSGMAVTVPGGAALLVAALGVAVFGFAVGWEFEISGDIGVWLAILGSLGIAYGAYEASRTPVMPASRVPAPGAPAAPPSAPVV